MITSLGPADFNIREDRTNGINHGEQAVGDFAVQSQFAIAQFDQQVFTDMGDMFKNGKPQKSTRSLDRVNCTENAR